MVLVPAAVVSSLPRVRVALIALLLCAAAAAAAAGELHDRYDRWEPDAAIYLRMALADRGAAPDAARRSADAFMQTTPEGRRDPALYGAHPPTYYATQFALFRGRPLFPALGAALLPAFGPHGMQMISAAAYALAVPLLFLLLASEAPLVAALIGAVLFALLPPVRDLASYALTDELALLLWIGALAAGLRTLRTGGWVAPAAWLACCVALAATRPAVYLPLGAALGALAVAAPMLRSRAMLLACIAAGVAASYFAYAYVVHAPGLVEQLRWEFGFARATGAAAGGAGAWYLRALGHALIAPLVRNVIGNAELPVLIALVVGIIGAPRGRLYAFAIGAALATLVAILANPLEVVRTVVLPLAPVALLLACRALPAFVTRRSARPAMPPPV